LRRDREERVQQRKAAAYLEMHASMSQRFDSANKRIWGSTSERARPLPKRDAAEEARLKALVAAYASPKVRKDYSNFLDGVTGMLRFSDASETSDMSEGQRKIELLRASSRAYFAWQAIDLQIRHELATERGLRWPRARQWGGILVRRLETIAQSFRRRVRILVTPGVKGSHDKPWRPFRSRLREAIGRPRTTK
jgi:hypothetical protein